MKLSEIEHRILALEHALSNLQQCPADPCHVHHTAVESVAEPKYDVTEESWYISTYGIFQYGASNCVCPRPNPDLYPEGIKLWPQRKVLIVHAPEMYRELLKVYELLCRSLNPELITSPSIQRLDILLGTIQKELKENE